MAPCVIRLQAPLPDQGHGAGYANSLAQNGVWGQIQGFLDDH